MEQRAFPCKTSLQSSCGMSLRDWFAGMALANGSFTILDYAPKVAAREAYKIADAMIAEHRKQNS